MAKIKEVCEKTGLSEKAVRLYMKEGLVTPETEEGIYRNAYSFSEKDIELLKDIAVLRNAGFGISDIRQMQQHPELVPAMIEEKQTLLETEIYEKKRLQNAEDEIQVATFPYGAFKNTWKEGTMIEIAWNPNESRVVLPLETGWMRKKALFYAVVGIGLWIAAAWVWQLL